ncbi:hypothetical protein [Fodinibius sp.]|uniref:hypothetical protein n=1 Tax=Fodinibius sp. TaxID=1872440 RepID=UPI00356B178E
MKYILNIATVFWKNIFICEMSFHFEWTFQPLLYPISAFLRFQNPHVSSIRCDPNFPLALTFPDASGLIFQKASASNNLINPVSFAGCGIYQPAQHKHIPGLCYWDRLVEGRP